MEVDGKESAVNQGKKKRKGVRNTAVVAQTPAVVENTKNNNEEEETEKEPQIDEASLVSVITPNSSSDDSGIGVSIFDYSADNHFRAMDMIYKLCGEADNGGFDQVEIERLASTVTFLSEWRYFNYKPRVVRFMPETRFSSRKEAHNDITLTQFSAASVPRCDLEAEQLSAGGSTDSGKDFVLYVGGLVWALDWCPRPEQGTQSDINCEFLAVAAHPPDSTYHKLGAPLNGRGMIQIWCLVNCSSNTIDSQTPAGKSKRQYQKKTASKREDTPKKPRGRPRKNPMDKIPKVVGPEKSLDMYSVEANVLNTPSSQDMPIPVENTLEKFGDDSGAKEKNKPKRPKGRPRKNPANKVASLNENELDSQKGKRKKQKDKVRKSAAENAPAVMDAEGQFTQALIVHPSEEISNVPCMDGNILTTSTLLHYKRKKRKSVTTAKNVADEITNISDSEVPLFRALAVEYPENMPNIFSTKENASHTPAPQEKMAKRRRVPTNKALNADLECTISELKKRSKSKLKAHELGHDERPTQNQDKRSSLVGQQDNIFEEEDVVLQGDAVRGSISDMVYSGYNISEDVLPRVVLCLGHDGKVAWDVKWRPVNACESNKHIMGYLAVVLANGSIEVWEIPSPQIIKWIYASQNGGATDPRFAKLKPVFRCSKLKHGDTLSMPLTVEWSASPPHDLILAGCHDGMVALWKFSAHGSSQDSRPLLCFRAETVPIRALSWAPFEGDPESANVIVTAGHGGLKFWDLRDPFRSLWDANPSQRFIYGLDWLPDPRCVLVSYDDGTLRMVSLSRAAYDVPVTGEPFTGTMQQGVHSYCCSSFAVWSIHVSRRTGMAAYCCADGTVLYFQLTHKAVDKDPLRNRAPHFLCGSLLDETSAVAVNTHLPTSPHRMKKSATEWANTPRPARSVASGSSQAKRVKKGSEKNRKSDNGTLALSYGDNEAQTSSSLKKGKPGISSKEVNSDQALTSIDEDGGNMNGQIGVKEEANNEIELPPSKIVSMYKVRWNMNKGSERWLCYGGAAGIVRCQEIVAPVFDKKLLKRTAS